MYIFASKIGYLGRALGVKRKIFIIDMKKVVGMVFDKALWIPSAIKLILVSGESVKFSGFINREKAMRELNKYAHTFMHVNLYDMRSW